MTEVTALIEARAVTSVLQPIVRMSTREIVGYEALARGPAGTRWESPVELFCAAAAIGRRAELDWVCRARAVEAALAAKLPAATALFINTEPGTCAIPCPVDLRPIFARAVNRIRIVLELTERAVSSEPAALLAASVAARSAGFGVAFDNVGGDPAVLALIAVARPDVIKLDPYLLCRPLCVETARVVEAVNEYAEQTGAVVAAAGIETDAHLRVAKAMGATLGQGWFFGRPVERLTSSPRTPREPLAKVTVPPTPPVRIGGAGATPFDIVTGRRPISRASAAMLLPIARRLEASAFDPAHPTVVLTCLRQTGPMTADMWDWYAELARRASLLAVGGAGLVGGTVPGAVVAGISPADRLRGEWDVIVVGPRFTAALVARDPVAAALRTGCESASDRLDFVVTYDRELVLSAARALLGRFTG